MATTYKQGEAPWESQVGQPTQPTTFQLGQAPWEVSSPPTPSNVEAQKPLSTADNYGAIFPSSPTDATGHSVPVAGLISGLKSAGNIPTSLYNFGKGVVSTVANVFNTNPDKNTILNIGRTAIGGGEALNRTINSVPESVVPKDKSEQMFNALAQSFKDRYGSLENLQKTATNDPIGFGTDVLSIIDGGAGLLGKSEELGNAVSKVSKVVTEPATKVLGKATDAATGLTKFGVSQATGLNPETLTELVKNPQAFKDFQPESRVHVAEGVKEALDQRLSELSDMGTGYQSIREGVPGNPGLVTIQPDTISSVLGKYGVKLDESNHIITSPESRPLSVTDKNALQDFIDNYGGVTNHTNNSFLNTREALSNLGKYDQGKTSLSTSIARDLRSQFDAAGKSQIPGLKELDAQYAPERQLLGSLKKDLFDPSGELKPNAISKIANLNGKGKENLLQRVKQVVPDIEQRVKVLKAVEDIEKSKGFKVGTYAKAGTTVAAIATGNIPLIVGSILAQPEIAVHLLKGAGYVGQKATPVLEAIKSVANDVNNFRLPEPILNYAKDPQMGLSIKNVGEKEIARVAKGIDVLDKSRMTKFIDYVRLKGAEDVGLEVNARKIIEGMGFNPDVPNSRIAEVFSKILDVRRTMEKSPLSSLKLKAVSK